ncbi:MAG TPA: hypothetical protein VK177_13135 [Flavobacteriales bacterium]|nr:hypothetical protein [Flavobacteriales bacterium]
MPASYYISASLLILLLFIIAIIFKRSGNIKTAERLGFGASLFIGFSVREITQLDQWYYRIGITLGGAFAALVFFWWLLRFVKLRKE